MFSSKGTSGAVAASMSAAPLTSALMSYPAMAIGNRPTGVSTEKRPPTSSDAAALAQLQAGPAKVVAVKAEEYDDEFLSLDLNVKIVSDLDDAIAHIREHGTQHSDAILTRDMRNAQRFVNEVDSSAVYVNASTRFTDGGQFGLGAEDPGYRGELFVSPQTKEWRVLF